MKCLFLLIWFQAVNKQVNISVLSGSWILFLGFLFLFNLKGLSQFPAFEKIRMTIPAEDQVFTKVIRDVNGYFWFGSAKGLFRFDGTTFIPYHPLSDSVDFHVTALYEDNDWVIWIGCADGKIFRMKNERIEHFDPEEGTSGEAITDILVAKDRTLWWSTAGEGIYFYANNRVFNINHDDGLRDDYVYDLENDVEGFVWAGTDGGLVSCVYRGGKKIVTPIDKSVELPDLIVKVVKADEQGNLWLGFQDGGAGFLRQDRKAFVRPPLEYSWEAGPVNAIVISDHTVWAGTTAGRLMEINAAGDHLEISGLLPENLSTGKIYDLMEDLEGNIWILASSGVYRSTGNRFRFLDHTTEGPLQNIHAIMADGKHPGVLWFSDDRGLFSFDPASGAAKRYLEKFSEPGMKVTCLQQDDYGYIWAGTFNYGVFRINPGDGSVTRLTEKQGLVNDNVLSVSRHKDTLWLATLGGASELVLDGSSRGRSYHINSFNYQSGLANNFIYSVYEDGHDQIWLATDGDGINVRTAKGWISYNEKDGLNDDVIYSITGDKYGNIWSASASRGIFKFDGTKFYHYGLDEGLNSLSISGITAVDDEILIICEDGLDILHIPSGIISHYGEDEGFGGIQPDLNAISADHEGNTWIGTRKGIIRYRAGNQVSYAPKPVLEEFSVYLEPRPMKENLVLGYNDNHVSFRYAGLWYTNPEKVVYQVMLEGYDLGWIDTYDRQVTYSSLSPGNYTFRVRSSLDKSFVNADEAGYNFRIRQPFWLSVWFIIPVILFIFTGIYLFIRMRENRLKKIEQEKKEKVEFEFQVLKNQVNPHFLFNSFSTLIALIEEQPAQAVAYTEKLSDFFRTILQYKDQKVISLVEELQLIESYFYLLKKRFGDNLDLNINLEKNIRETFIPPLTLQILIENAVKHNVISKDKPLVINIYEDEGRIIVENNLQPKLTAEVSTGIGLENIRKRYRLITQNEIVTEKTDLIFRISLPIII